jgi:signal transduction histidine kinase
MWTPIDSSRGGTRRFLVWAFAAITIACSATTLVALRQIHAVHEKAERIVENALTRIRLLSRMARDIDQERVLLYEHIEHKEREVIDRLEETMVRLASSRAKTGLLYGELTTLPHARELWEQLSGEMENVQLVVAKVLALSRENLDAEARAALHTTHSLFDTMNRDFNALIEINDHEAGHVRLDLNSARTELLVTLGCLGVALIVATLVIGRWTIRLVGDREQQAMLHSKMLEDRNRELDAFAARVAHDLRDPLTAVRLATAGIEQEVPRATAMTELLRRGVLNMEMLIDDLLALSRVSSQERGSCDPAAVAAQIREDYAARVERLQGSLRVEVAPASVICSSGLLRQALANLAENALKYRRPEVTPEIEIRGEPKLGTYELRVTDNGIGMSPDEASRAFEPFYRAVRARDLPGTGLGLSIVKRVAEANGGTVELESQLGQGTTLVIRLPLSARDKPPGE